MGSDSGVCLEESKLQMQYPSSVSTGQVPESQHRLVEHQVPKQTDAQLVMSSDIKVKQEVSSLENMINSTTQKSSKKHSLTKTLFQKTKDRLFSWKENSLTTKTGSNFYVPYTSEKASPQERPLPPLPCVSTPLDVTKSKACEQIENASGEEDYKVKSCMEPESFLESVMSSIEWNPYLRFSKLSDSTESGIFMNKTEPCDSSTPSAAIDPKSCEDCVTDDSGFKEKKPLNILNIYSNVCSITPNTRVSHLNSCGSPSQPSTCLKQISLEGKRTLWKDIPEVMKSGLLETMTSQQIQQQEALFEIITSEVSYLRSLDILVEHFVNCPELTSQLSANRILEQAEREMLFSDILPVRTISQRLLAELKARLSEGLLIPNICDILLNYALNHFSIYVKYCSNKIYQEMMLYSLRQNKPEFKTLLEKLEKSPVCQNLSVDSFLILPMQRITRFPLLVKAVCDRLPTDSPDFKISILALKAMNKVVKDCNEGAEVMEKRIEMLCLSHQLEFKICESFKLMSASRWLVKKGEVIWLSPDQRTKSTLGRTTHCTKVPIHMFLFTDLLVLAKKNSEEKYTVIVYCQRKFVQMVLLNRSLKPNIPAHTEDCKKVFLLLMSNNHKGKTTEVILSCSSKY
ncbi:rho guanine nucleotide exchange factor 16-like isoform X2 [Tachypleus tridentatus]|uniref:rho guanine nucleotide exchange factor 16-like isoform X2 n=1 Tax=Tachypleus tridentatus TaxID=6853 RepID=UPI003FD09584